MKDYKTEKIEYFKVEENEIKENEIKENDISFGEFIDLEKQYQKYIIIRSLLIEKYNI